MNRKRLLKQLVFLVFFIFIANFLANKFYWYSSIWYFDMIMHTLGGIWLGLTYIYIFNPQNLDPKTIFKVLLFVLAIGVGWELFEIIFYNYLAGNPFNTLDTISDIFFDLTGGSIATLYFSKRIVFIAGDGVQLT